MDACPCNDSCRLLKPLSQLTYNSAHLIHESTALSHDPVESSCAPHLHYSTPFDMDRIAMVIDAHHPRLSAKILSDSVNYVDFVKIIRHAKKTSFRTFKNELVAF